MNNITIVYQKPWVLGYVRQKVDEISHVITDIDKLETRIYKQLSDYFSRGKTSYKRVQYLVNREIDLALKQFGTQNIVVFSDLTKRNDFGESMEFEPEDLLAQGGETVIENISLSEEIARLAADDRELFTLNAWANGFSDPQVYTTLARHFGGNQESHRKFVQRFKVKCQERIEKERLAKTS